MIPRTAATTLRPAGHTGRTVTGPRQSGKTTLCRAAFPGKSYVNLEQPDVRAFAQEDPRGFLRAHHDGAILDEIQRAPELPSYLQAIVDEQPRPGRYILTGSEQFEVLNRISQSLAGRTGILRLLPFSVEEMVGHFPIRPAERLILTVSTRASTTTTRPYRALGDYFAAYVRAISSAGNVGDLSRSRFVRPCGAWPDPEPFGPGPRPCPTPGQKWFSWRRAISRSDCRLISGIPPSGW
jgi:hypothetical protein